MENPYPDAVPIKRNAKTCSGKNCYSKHKATIVMHAAMRRRNRKLKVYECDECFYRHISSNIGEKTRENLNYD